MKNEIWDIKRGLKARLEGIPGLRAITFEPEDWRDFPVAIIRTESRSATRAGVSGSRFEAEFVVTIMAGGAKRSESYDALDSYIATDGAMSVEAAIAGDRTLGGAADRARLAGVGDVRVARMGGGRYVAADFRIRVQKRSGSVSALALVSGSNVIDLLGSPYFASGDAIFAPVERAEQGQPATRGGFAPRAVETELRMRESKSGEIRAGLAALNSTLALAERRTGSEWSSAVRLRRGHGGANVEYRVLRGRVEFPTASGEDGAGLGVKLGLSVEALGRQAGGQASATLSNESDGANLNYLDITNIGGTHGAPARIKAHDPSGTWSGARKMWIGKRSGEGREDNLFFQGESGAIVRGGTIFDESGGIWSGSSQPLSGASGGQYARMAWTKAGRYKTRSEFTLCGYVRVGVAASVLPRGRFRVLARARTETNNAALRTGKMGFALGWSFGSEAKTPVESDAVFPQTAAEFRTLDLGELTLPPTATPEGYSTAGFDLRVYGALSEGGAGNVSGTHHFRWSVDYILLLPIDEGEAAVSGVASSNRVLLDTLSEAGAGVYSLDATDAAQGPADFEGAPFTIGPEDTRIYVARDDVSDPSGVKFAVAASWTPLSAGF